MQLLLKQSFSKNPLITYVEYLLFWVLTNIPKQTKSARNLHILLMSLSVSWFNLIIDFLVDKNNHHHHTSQVVRQRPERIRWGRCGRASRPTLRGGDQNPGQGGRPRRKFNWYGFLNYPLTTCVYYRTTSCPRMSATTTSAKRRRQDPWTGRSWSSTSTNRPWRHPTNQNWNLL